MQDELAGMKVDILGVDYPSQALDRARTGRYTHFEVQRGLPAKSLVKYFEQDGQNWMIKDRIREQVEFKDIHLLSKLDSLNDFHAVMFCGSLPHYSAPARVRVLRGLSGLVRENGYLILGEDESLSQMNFGFDRAAKTSGLYKKREVIIEPEVDPTLKIPNGRTTFEKTPKRQKSISISKP